ncbi:MAG: hypothetical protein ACI97A_004044 [Planctomycetota bacterium]|jgi:hypothetical protein
MPDAYPVIASLANVAEELDPGNQESERITVSEFHWPNCGFIVVKHDSGMTYDGLRSQNLDNLRQSLSNDGRKCQTLASIGRQVHDSSISHVAVELTKTYISAALGNPGSPLSRAAISDCIANHSKTDLRVVDWAMSKRRRTQLCRA